jgi:SNF2 family DNA or RNA helicase
MSKTFATTCHPDFIEVGLVDKPLLGRAKPVARSEWNSASGGLRPAALRLLALASDGSAEWRGDALCIPNEVACEFPGVLADAIGLPPPAPVMVDVSFHGGAITSENPYIQTEWKLTTYQSIEPKRVGLRLDWGGGSGRLQGALYTLIDAVDAFNAVSGSTLDDKVDRWASVSAAVKRVNPNSAEVDAYTKSLTVLQAGSFSLDVSALGERVDDFRPVLMQRSKAKTLDDNAPTEDLDASEDEAQEAADALIDEHASGLLTAEDQRRFLDFFAEAGPVKPAYPLRRQTFLLIDPDLRSALNVVKTARAGSRDEKRRFVKNPRAAIADALGADVREGLTTAVFVETRQYSDRVTGLGLWEPPQLSWLSKVSTQWLPEIIPVEIDGESVDVTRTEFGKLEDAVKAAETTGTAEVDFKERKVKVDEARRGIDKAKQFLESGGERKPPPTETAREAGDAREIEAETDGPPPPQGQVVTLLKTNFEALEYSKAIRKPRHSWGEQGEISTFGTRTKFKPHQDDGFRWLVESWLAGWPGVLLADDMGLGKSYQALAFLAWVKRNQDIAVQRGMRRKLPILVVAPTALLDNWIKESKIHLFDNALGQNRADVFGPGIRKFRNTEPATSAPEALNWRKIEEHDWVLTTYETLANYQTSFARILFSVGVFDEIQKIKDPGTLNSVSAKSVNAEFVLGLSGTPVENRIEDLWSVMDRVVPGFLGELKKFSSTYKDAMIEDYRILSDMLMKPVDEAPAIILRRMKADVLEGLPPKTIDARRIEMPEVQQKKFEEIVRGWDGAKARGRGAMLEVVQKLRAVSLFPGDPAKFDLTTRKGVADWKGQSARLARTFEILHELEAKGQRGLVFIEHRGMQALLAQAISTEFDIEPPIIINGATPGARRPAMVEEFEARKTKFDLMVLSPKAAGVGLTILSANHVIHLSRWWNPAIEDQCNDRVYRIGAKLPVTVHIPIAVHPRFGDDSFDVQLDRLVNHKRKISNGLLMPPVSDADIDAFNMAA